VYPPRDKGGRWRAVWHEDGERRQCASVSDEKLAAKLEKVRQRLAMGASNILALRASHSRALATSLRPMTMLLPLDTKRHSICTPTVVQILLRYAHQIRSIWRARVPCGHPRHSLIPRSARSCAHAAGESGAASTYRSQALAC
jgi:hypothetical protein